MSGVDGWFVMSEEFFLAMAICLQIHKKFPHVRLKNQEENEKEKIVSLSLKTQKSL